MIGGKSNSGKGTVAEHLEKYFQQDENINVIRCSLSTYVRQIAKNDFYWDGVDTPISRKFMAEVYRIGTELYPYHMAKRVWERDIIPNLKYKSFVYNYNTSSYTREYKNLIIIESFREKVNYEYFKILKNNGAIQDIITIRVNRPGYDVVGEELKNHVSESDLDDFKFDYYIINGEDLFNLKSVCTYVAIDIMGKYKIMEEKFND